MGYPGGWIDPGETMAQAAVRELLEETEVRTKSRCAFKALDAFGYEVGCRRAPTGGKRTLDFEQSVQIASHSEFSVVDHEPERRILCASEDEFGPLEEYRSAPAL